MELIEYLSGTLAVSQLLFMGLFYFFCYRQERLGTLMAFYSFCLIGYIVANLVTSDGGLALFIIIYVLGILAVASPAVLWVIARYLFEDNPRVHPAAWVVIGFYLLLRTVNYFLPSSNIPLDGGATFVLFQLPSAIMLGFTIHVIYMAFEGRNIDLIEPRRRLRVPFAIAMGSITACVIGSGLFLQSSAILDTIFFSMIFLFILIFNLASLRLRKDWFQLIEAPNKPAGTSPSDSSENNSNIEQATPELVQRIQDVMQRERLYAETGLTIADLANKIPMQEYRLRRVINQQLSYRNFNQFLNQYRIEEASSRLLNTAESHLPISTIALDVGYGSLSSFNKAFKEAHAVTPSQYRAQPSG